MKSALFACAAAVLCLAGAASAQTSPGPRPFPMPPKTEAPQDIAYPGVLKVQVDATDKLHARGPVGAEQLTTCKYVVRGSGQVRP